MGRNSITGISTHNCDDVKRLTHRHIIVMLKLLDENLAGSAIAHLNDVQTLLQAIVLTASYIIVANGNSVIANELLIDTAVIALTELVVTIVTRDAEADVSRTIGHTLGQRGCSHISINKASELATVVNVVNKLNLQPIWEFIRTVPGYFLVFG